MLTAGKARSCGSTVCGACGSRYNPDSPSALHACPEMVPARVWQVLQALAKQRAAADSSTHYEKAKKTKAGSKASSKASSRGRESSATAWSKGVGFGGSEGAALNVATLSKV